MKVSHRLLAPNFYRVDVGSTVFWFSYDTCIAFAVQGNTVISENVWTTTTGSHLSLIDGDKSKRVDHATFTAILDKVRVGDDVARFDLVRTVLARVRGTNIHTRIRDMADTWELLRQAVE
jgi:hypothetical protein